ncbi:MAG: electron transfer flavoprotein subunit beta/FixA family protein [Coxiella endosymbiont of Haemaphysalis qinghaiensis]
MKVLVAVKRIIDSAVKIRVKPDGSGIETDQVRMIMNPFDEIAVEEAVRLKDKGLAEEVIVVSISSESSQEILRSALAMGADQAIFITTDQPTEPLQVAHLLKAVIERESPRLVILGKQAIDDDCNQTGQMLAALLDWPQGTFVSECIIEEGRVRVTREIDEGLETISLRLPAVITTDLRLNTPRYTTLHNIMKAKSKPLKTLTPEELQVSLYTHLKILKVERPPEKNGGVKISNIKELLNILKEKHKVLP